MKPPSKKSRQEEQICPSCGEWKTTDFTPQELQEKEWECSDCMNKRLTHPEDLPENRGEKEISKFDPEYEFLKKLVNVIGKAVPEAIPEIKALSQVHPFETIDDAGDLAAQIWTLATEKYHIPREWLIKKLPEKKIKSDLRDDEWPAQRAAEDFGMRPWNETAYESWKNTEASEEKQASPETDHALAMSIGEDIIQEYFFEKGIRWSQVVQFIKDQAPQLTDEDIANLKTDTKYKLEQFKIQIESKKKGLSLNDVLKILESKGPKPTHVDHVTNTIEFIDGSVLNFDSATRKALELSKNAEEEEVFNTPEMNFYWGPVDLGKRPEGDFPSNEWLPAGTEDLDQQDPTNVMAFSKKELNKVANPASRFWIAPDGKEFPVPSAGHGAWIIQNKNILKQYGINLPNESFKKINVIWNQMIDTGWIRVGNEPAGTGFQIEVADLTHIPSSVDNIIAKYFKQGNMILLGDRHNRNIDIRDPFPSIQKAVNKALRNPVNAMLKKADISGKVVNDILALIEQTGGSTYNLQQGSLANTPNFAVSSHKDRERIVDLVDYDTLEGYIDDNLDLLNDPKNSLGIWISGGKVYLDVTSTVPTKEEALQLAYDNQQLAIFDLSTMTEISVDLPAFSKKELSIIKKAEDSLLSIDQENQIASKWGPKMNIALNNYANAAKNGHDSIRALKYALSSVINIGGVKESDLREAIGIYLKGLV